MSQKESFGIMDEGYFVPRTEILQWLNNLLGLSLTKIQQLGSGAVYCQIIDVIHPGKIAINKVNWKAKNDYQFIANLKILQSAFQKIGIKRYVEVEKLARAKYQDNLEFIQWLKRYYDLNGGGRGDNYMAEERRGSAPVDFSFADKNVVPKTYNGSGQVVKNQKAEMLQKLQKKKQPNTNITSVVASYRNENKSRERKKQNVNQNSNSKKPQGKDQNQSSKIKQLEQKLQMIRQIAESNESSDSRMKLIQQVLNIKSGSDNEKTQKKQEKSQQKMDEELIE